MKPGALKYSGTATATGGIASLEDLAYDITGQRSDYTDITIVDGSYVADDHTKVTATTKVDISKLLEDLDGRLRTHVLDAVNDITTMSKNGTAISYFGSPNRAQLNAYNAAQIQNLFKPGTPHSIPIDCYYMALIVETKGLLDLLEPNEYAEFGTMWSAGRDYMTVSHPSLDNIKRGTWTTFHNNDKYVEFAPLGEWRQENVIATATPDSFWGYSVHPKTRTYDEWKDLLLYEFNTEAPPGLGLPAPDEGLDDIPGYDGNAWFWNAATVAGKTFKIRSPGQSGS
jgi:hypothetical protein